MSTIIVGTEPSFDPVTSGDSTYYLCEFDLWSKDVKDAKQFPDAGTAQTELERIEWKATRIHGFKSVTCQTL